MGVSGKEVQVTFRMVIHSCVDYVLPPLRIRPMSLLAVFGIGFSELVCVLGCVGVFGVIIVGIIVAVAVANRGKDDRRE